MLSDLDVVLLSRIQFAFTIGFHILFPTLTIGLALFLVGIEAAWLKTGNPVYFRLYRLWTKIFALSFGMGVVSGIVLSYQIGTNFSRFADAVGPVIGPLLSVEVLTAFFVEAGFIGVMLFGWRKVGPRLHFLATMLVALGTLNSAFWVIAANSWMHTPAGVVFEAGRFIVDDWWAVIFNPSFPYRLTHMLLASFLTTAFVLAGVSAWYLLRGRQTAIARKAFSIALVAAAFVAPAQIVMGDLHGLQVKEHQPVKLAAMEGLWDTTRGAPLLLFALPDQDAGENLLELGIPKLASLVLTRDLDGEVQGLNEVSRDLWPNVPLVFWSFRLMVGIGLALLAVAAYGVLQRWRGRLYQDRVLLRACVASAPLGFVATIAGWITAEVGRQPFTVHGLLTTAESVSPVTATAVATSLVAFAVVYGALLLAYLYYAAKLLRRGADEAEPLPERLDEHDKSFGQALATRAT